MMPKLISKYALCAEKRRVKNKKLLAIINEITIIKLAISITRPRHYCRR